VAVCIGAKTWRSPALNDALAAGAMSYLASPLWLALAIAAVAEVHRHAASGTVTYVGRYPVLPWLVSHTVEFIALPVPTMGMLFGS